MVEVITLAGFFFICIMEEVLHHFLQPHEPTADCDTFMDTHKPRNEEGMWQSWGNTNNNGMHLDEFKRYDRKARGNSNSPRSPNRTNNSITDVRAYENQGYRDSNREISTVSGCE